METEVGVEGNDEGKFDENGAATSSSTFSSPKQFADPVVYKLVRLEGDGRLVPATDDEVMEVKSLLVDVKSEMHIVSDNGQTIGLISNEGSAGGMPQLTSKEGLSQNKEGEAGSDKLNALLEKTASALAPRLSESQMKQSGIGGECSNPGKEPIQGGLPTCKAVTDSRPDFSMLKGEICLDNLTIRELHETFKATFGRETTVKDKHWLKRRITMGLTNSCDVSTTTFVIKDNKLVKKDDAEKYNVVDDSFARDPTIGEIDGNKEVSPCHHGQMQDLRMISEKTLRMESMGDNSAIHDHQAENRAAKRVRKPTKRYIEELSESESKESSGKSTMQSGLGQVFPESHVKPARTVSVDGRTITTRLDSLGGSGVQVPCVSRVRRSRPRKNFMALLKFNPSGKAMTSSLVKDAFGARSFQRDDMSKDSFMKAISVPQQVYQFVAMPGKDEQLMAGDVGQGKKVDEKRINSSGASNDNLSIVPTPKGGIRRKHHRAWTISEVMKLVEGVSRYGAGRWSEIKRLAFASYSYRTSVDLKINSRKNTGSMPIPEPILSRVRELAEMQAQAPPNLSSSKVVGVPRNNVQDKPSGYL
ncbi:hypothetical protein Tsubulata_044621 [Turnera subulata]|uniref:HTH myb-type domain-containing protein n=1 Tax=Turnera subulata TaxID=218843 RepID=A0A9Q0JA34_9ROSI|nr:hypothetical protein Tsubulata_044621 [Turnera subulata]